MYKGLFTSESVSRGHPDKICDQIADLIVDKALSQDKNSRTAIEVMATKDLIIIAGEIKTVAKIDYKSAAYEVLLPLGYSKKDFDIVLKINNQSPDIEQGVDKANCQLGAGDQGMMFGFATNETKSLMPLPITLAHEIMERAECLRLTKEFVDAKSDMKTQVTIDRSQGKALIKTIVISIQHESKYDRPKFVKFIKEEILYYVAKKYNLNTDFEVLINPTGKFVIGGPEGDTGLTGRKIIVDTYGGMGRHGGGAFSGKDYTKVDRSAAYAARWVAKNIVAAKLAKKIEVQVSYAIGMPKPISLSFDAYGSQSVDLKKIGKAVNKVFDLSLGSIIRELDLKRPIYFQTSVFGHFGRPKLNLPWEKTNKVDLLLKAIDSD